MGAGGIAGGGGSEMGPLPGGGLGTPDVPAGGGCTPL